MPRSRTVCFVTGTRAEFGLMRTALDAIRAHRRLRLQIIATGMHLDSRHGRPLAAINSLGYRPDATVAWARSDNPAALAATTGRAIAALGQAMEKLAPDIVLVVGDRVEAFAAASAAHISRRVLAHVHGGDRAPGQIDDSLRHAITKLAHIHFPATAASARRILRLGEDPWRIHRVGSPGCDGITAEAETQYDLIQHFPGIIRPYALVLQHPTVPNETVEEQLAHLIIEAIRRARFEHLVLLYPNNDPGSAGIIHAWETQRYGRPNVTIIKDLSRPVFLGLLRDAAALVGNSSSGIIEAAKLGTPVVDIGPRQQGRERSADVVHCDANPAQIRRELQRIWNDGRPRRSRAVNVYAGDDAGRRMADILARIDITGDVLHKLIRY